MCSSKSIALRAPEPEDVDRLFLWENDTDLSGSLPHAAPLSRMQVWEYVRNYNADPFAAGELRMMIVDCESGATVGHVDIFDFCPADRRAGIAIYIDESCRRQGYAAAALAEMERYVRLSLGLHMLWAIVAVSNIASRELFSCLGFKISGKLRSWLRRDNRYEDVFLFQKLLV